MISYKLFLDDERDPIGDDWVICRSYNEFVMAIYRKGFPSFISFDHDLGHKYSGYTAAEFLVNMDLWSKDDDGLPNDFHWYVHSQNPVGKKNIEGLLERYMKFKKEST